MAILSLDWRIAAALVPGKAMRVAPCGQQFQRRPQFETAVRVPFEERLVLEMADDLVDQTEADARLNMNLQVSLGPPPARMVRGAQGAETARRLRGA